MVVLGLVDVELMATEEDVLLEQDADNTDVHTDVGIDVVSTEE